MIFVRGSDESLVVAPGPDLVCDALNVMSQDQMRCALAYLKGRLGLSAELWLEAVTEGIAAGRES